MNGFFLFIEGWKAGRDEAEARARKMANDLARGESLGSLPAYTQMVTAGALDVADAIGKLEPPISVPALVFLYVDPPKLTSPFRVVVTKAEEVVDHPFLGSWSQVTTPEGVAMAPKMIGQHRYAVGDLVVFVPKGSLVHGKVLCREGYFQLAPGQIDRRHVTAYNILLPTFTNDSSGIVSVLLYGGKTFPVQEGDDVASLLLIEEAPHAT